MTGDLADPRCLVTPVVREQKLLWKGKISSLSHKKNRLEKNDKIDGDDDGMKSA